MTMIISFILLLAVIMGFVWCGRRLMDMLDRRVKDAARFEDQTLMMLDKLVKNDKELMQAMTAENGERMVKVPLKAVILAAKRLQDAKKIDYDLFDDTPEEVSRQEKEIERQKDLERKVEHGFIFTMVQDEMEGRNGQTKD